MMVSRYADTGQAIQGPDPDAGDASLPQDTQAGTSADASQRSKLGQMWDSWTSRPENNAALLNFGLQMMQPVPAGQSKLGHFAEAIGAGAEASGRNVEAQEARVKEEQRQDIAERQQQVREEEGGAYSQYMRTRNLADKSKLNQTIRDQQRFKAWTTAKDPGEDLVSQRHNDPTVERIRHMDPRWAKYSKADVLQDPSTSRIAQNIFTGEGGGAGTPSGAVDVATPADAAKLPQGTRYRTPDGNEYIR